MCRGWHIMIISHERKNSYFSHNTTLAPFSLTLLKPIGAVDKVILKRKIQSLNCIIILPHMYVLFEKKSFHFQSYILLSGVWHSNVNSNLKKIMMWCKQPDFPLMQAIFKLQLELKLKCQFSNNLKMKIAFNISFFKDLTCSTMNSIQMQKAKQPHTFISLLVSKWKW